MSAKFPSPAAGSYEILGLNNEVCFTSSSRYGPYGWSTKETKTEWPEVKWGELQQKCLQKNQHRFKADEDEGAKGKKPRQAVVLRGHEKFKWRPNDFIYTRSLIAELALATGGEYEVIFMIQLNGDEHSSLTPADLQNSTIVDPLKERYVPAEFRDLVIFFNTNVLKETYPKVGEWSYTMQSYQPVQWLALSHPEFTHFWVIEQDLRIIGHNYEFFNSIGEWARKQPRELLWERNSQIFFPAIHKTWDNFVRIIKENTPGEGVLGPKSPPQTETYSFTPALPLPSPIPKDWGVGEDADVISLSRIWDPVGSGWVFENYVKGFPPDTPRRTSPPNSGRFSRRVLLLTHEEQVRVGTCVAGEATNPTTALHHGLKAVFAPIPMYYDEDVDPKDLYKAFAGHEAGQPFDTSTAHLNMAIPDNQHNRWERLTFAWTNYLAEELYKWFIMSNGTNSKVHESPSGRHTPLHEPCFPAMALHPIKDV